MEEVQEELTEEQQEALNLHPEVVARRIMAQHPGTAPQDPLAAATGKEDKDA